MIRASGFVVATLIAFAGFAVNSFSQSAGFSVDTDKATYSAGERVVITGTIPPAEQPSPLIIQVFDPGNTAIFTVVPRPDMDGKFSVELDTSDWQVSGTYLIQVTYTDLDEELDFEFVGLDSQPPKENLVVTFSDGSSQSIDAEMTNGIITRIVAVEESATLVFSTATGSEDGELVLVLPRELIDSKFEPDEEGLVEDDGFLVLADAEYVDYNETASTTADRTLVVQIPAGTREVMIGGSSMMPEFPVFIGLILAIALVPLVLRSRMRI
jgi:hypothetical protein